jgi:hypothetical protein
MFLIIPQYNKLNIRIGLLDSFVHTFDTIGHLPGDNGLNTFHDLVRVEQTRLKHHSIFKIHGR